MYRDVSAARGITGVDLGRPGDPESDDGWYAVGDWMDTARAQELLRFQRHTWPELLDDLRTNTGWQRTAVRLLAPLVRATLRYRSPYRGQPGSYTDVWPALQRRFGTALLDGTAPLG